MRKTASKRTPKEEPASEPGTAVEFCLNCDDMDDMAVDGQADHPDLIKKRFLNCEATGKFQGDVCSRMFVAEPGDTPGPLYEDDE